jgi:hypothetical protein
LRSAKKIRSAPHRRLTGDRAEKDAIASVATDFFALFTMLWKLEDGAWRLARVMSYGHLASP